MAPRIIFPHTECAHTAIIRYHGKRRLFRAYHTKGHATKRIAKITHCRLAIAHTLFPQNFPKPIGITYILFKNPGDHSPEKRWGVVNEIIKNRPKHYKRYQKDFYSVTEHSEFNALKNEPHFIAQEKDFSDSKKRVSELAEMGINVEDHTVNTVVVNGTPKFFEPPWISPEHIRKNLSHFPPNTQKKVDELLDQYEHLLPHRASRLR